MIYILNQNSSFIPPKDHTVAISLKHEIGYIQSIIKHHNNIMWNATDVTVDEFNALKKYRQLVFDNIPIPSRTRTCDSDDIIIIPLGMHCYNIITFKPIESDSEYR